MNMPIRILDINFSLLCEISDYESFSITRHFDTFGEFSLKINKYKNNIQSLVRGNIVFINSDKAGIIEHRELSVGNEGSVSEFLIIKGYTLEHIFAHRITDVKKDETEWKMEGFGEDILKVLVSTNMGSLASENRRFDLLSIAKSKGLGKSLNISSRYEKLNEKCTEIAIAGGLGFKISIDYVEKKFMFDVYSGRDITTKQSVYPPVIFSVEYGNIENQNLIDSTVDYKNTAIVINADKSEIINDANSGINRRELFVDASDIRADSTETLADRGNTKLSELKAIYTLEGNIKPFNSFYYEKDYFLGDIVTVKFLDIGGYVSLDTRIIQVNEVWDSNGYIVNATFGDKVLNLIDKVKLYGKR